MKFNALPFVLVAGALFALAPHSALAVTIVNDGSTITRSDPADGTDAIQLDNGSTAVINTGGTVINTGTQPGSMGISARRSSNVTVSGGTVQGRDENNGGRGIETAQGGQIDITGGTISGGEGQARGGWGIAITGGGAFTMSGGQVTGGEGLGHEGGIGLGIFDDSTGFISGGTITPGVSAAGFNDPLALWVTDMAQVTLSGGTFEGDLLLGGNATLTIIGADLAFSRSTRELTGFWEDGSVIDLTLIKAPDAFLTFVDVPITTPPTVPLPASALLLFGGVLSFGAMSGRRASV